jgi:glycosyltransferase involved in cell wall biosynthesis
MPPTTPPRLSIGMPIYNGEKYMAETIDSVLDQGFTDFELIISDNCSTDATAEIAQGYAARDERVRYVRNAVNLGAARNYNQLVAFARGEFFKWQGYDDVLRPGYLERCVAALDADPGAILAYPRTSIIDGEGAFVRDHEDNLFLSSPDPVERVRAFTAQYTLCNACFGVIRKDVLDKTALVQPFVSSDVPLLVELALLGRWVEVPERLFLRRIHETSSRQGRVTMLQVAKWFDPDNKRPISPRSRLVAECLRAIGRADVPPAVRSKAAAVFTATWTARRTRVLGGAAKANLRARRAGTAGSAASAAPASDAPAPSGEPVLVASEPSASL